MITKFFLKTLFLLSLFFLVSPPVRAEDMKTLSFTATYSENILNVEIMKSALRQLGYSLDVSSTGMSNALALASTEADGLRVAANPQWTAVNTFLSLNNPLLIKNESNIGAIFSLLENGVAGVAFIPLIYGTPLTIPEGLKELPHIGHTEVYPYLNKKHSALVSDLTASLERLKADGTIASVQSNSKKNSPDGRLNILHVSSYYPDMAYERRLEESLYSFFDDITRYSVNTINLNAKRIPCNNRISLFCDSVFSTYADYRPDIVIAADDAAADMVLEFHNSLFRNIPVVFCSLGDDNDKKRVETFSGNIYGFFEELPLQDILTQMLALYPETENIYVINWFCQTSSGKEIEATITACAVNFKNRESLLILINDT